MVKLLPYRKLQSTKLKMKSAVNCVSCCSDRTRSVQIVVDGKSVKSTKTTEKFYFVLNKPNGYHCTSERTAADGTTRRVVLSLFDKWIQNWKKRNPKVRTLFKMLSKDEVL